MSSDVAMAEAPAPAPSAAAEPAADAAANAPADAAASAAAPSEPPAKAPEVASGKRERKRPVKFEAGGEGTGSRKRARKAGGGVPLGEIPNVAYMLSQTKAKMDEIVMLHRLCVGSSGVPAKRKANLREFSGFVFEKEGDREKMRARMVKENVAELRKAARVLDVKLASKSEKKGEVVEALLEMLENPKVDPERPDLKEVAVKAREKKAKSREVKKMRAERRKEKRRKKKATDTDSESGTDGEEEDDDEEEEEEEDDEDEDEEDGEDEDDVQPRAAQKVKKSAAPAKKSAAPAKKEKGGEEKKKTVAATKKKVTKKEVKKKATPTKKEAKKKEVKQKKKAGAKASTAKQPKKKAVESDDEIDSADEIDYGVDGSDSDEDGAAKVESKTNGTKAANEEEEEDDDDEELADGLPSNGKLRTAATKLLEADSNITIRGVRTALETEFKCDLTSRSTFLRKVVADHEKAKK